MLTNENEMVYNWADIEKAIDMVKAFPWGRKLKKAEYFTDACELVELSETICDVVGHPFAVDSWYAKDYHKKAFDNNFTAKERKEARKACELHIKSSVKSLANGCKDGTYKCNFWEEL